MNFWSNHKTKNKLPKIFITQTVFSISPNTRRLSRYLSAVAGSLTTERELKELETFIKCKDNKEVFDQIKQGVDQSLENVQIRVGWKKNGEQDVANILANYEKEE